MSTKPNGRAVWPNFNTVELWFETMLTDKPLVCTLEVEEARGDWPATYTLVAPNSPSVATAASLMPGPTHTAAGSPRCAASRRWPKLIASPLRRTIRRGR